MRNFLGKHLIHFGWAIWGQECDCGHTPFNGLARVMARVGCLGRVDESRFGEAIYRVGSLFYRAGMSLDPEM